MFGSGLYFPHIDIRDTAWLRSAVLFWDEILTIAPGDIDEPYQNPESRICNDWGFLKPLRCELHDDVIENLGRKIIRSHNGQRFRRGEQYRENEMFESIRRDRGRTRLDGQLYRMHPSKMSAAVRNVLESQRYINGREDDWLLVDRQFAEAYMAALASTLSERMNISPLASSDGAQSTAFRYMLDDYVSEAPTDAYGAMIAVMMRSLNVDPEVPVERLLQFKEQRRDQYLDFAAKIFELSTLIRNSEHDDDGRRLFHHAKVVYDSRIEPSLRALKRELNSERIRTTWGGVVRALCLTVPPGVLSYLYERNTPVLLGAAAALAAADIGVQNYLAGRKIRSAQPLYYLHDIQNRFGMPDFEEL